MSEMPMPGGWTMTMAWMRMPGETWTATAASFVEMWILMMVPMMLPALIPMLVRYRASIATAATSLAWRTVIVGGAYFGFWTVTGLVAFPIGFAIAALLMREPALSRAAPIAAGVVVIAAGAIQLSAWKLRRLRCCREGAADDGQTMASPAWTHGVRLGMECARCCGNLMAILVVMGMMDVQVRAAVTAAIAAERLAPAGERVARAIGVVTVGGGLLLVARAAGLVG